MRFLRRRGRPLLAMLLLLAAVGCERWLNGNVVEAFFTALDAHSGESSIALFHEDARFVLPEQTRPFEGAARIRELIDWWILLEISLTWDGAEPDPQDPTRVIVGELRQSDRMLSAFGLPEVRRAPGSTFTIDGGLIRHVELQPIDETGRQAMVRGASRFQSWLRETDPGTAGRLYAGEAFSAELAELWSATLERYVAEVSPDTGTSVPE